MCYLVVERYSVCRCLYYQHSVDMCAAYGTQGHGIQERTVLVGYACDKHSSHQPYQDSSAREQYSDSGYYTASHSSRTQSSRRSRRWNILSSVTGCSWQSRPLVRFEFNHWANYLFSFRAKTSTAPPSELTRLLVGHDRIRASSAPWSFCETTKVNYLFRYLSTYFAHDHTIYERTCDATTLTKLSRTWRKEYKRSFTLHSAHTKDKLRHTIIERFGHCIAGFFIQA